jgi:hypothetical protein
MHTQKWDEGDTCSNTSIYLEKKSHLGQNCKATNCSNDTCIRTCTQKNERKETHVATQVYA